MSAYMLLCNFTDQGIGATKEARSDRPGAEQKVWR